MKTTKKMERKNNYKNLKEKKVNKKVVMMKRKIMMKRRIKLN